MVCGEDPSTSSMTKLERAISGEFRSSVGGMTIVNESGPSSTIASGREVLHSVEVL